MISEWQAISYTSVCGHWLEFLGTASILTGLLTDMPSAGLRTAECFLKFNLWTGIDIVANNC